MYLFRLNFFLKTNLFSIINWDCSSQQYIMALIQTKKIRNNRLFF